MTDKVMIEVFRNDGQRDDKSAQGWWRGGFFSGLFL